MKKNHIFSILTAVCVMVVMMSSCNKNEGDVVTMRGYSDQFGNGKVYIDNNNMPKWTEGDTLMANDVAYSIALDQGVAVWRMPAAAIYKAVYPANLVNDMSDNTVRMTIPKHQPYYEVGGVQVLNAPMGVCSSETDLHFKNLGALLAITVNNNSSQGDIVLDKVTVKSVNDAIALCGNAVVENFTPSASEYYYRITDEPSTTNSSVELVKGTSDPNTFASLNLPIAASDCKVVYVYVPAVANLVANRYEITVDAHAGSENITVTRTQPAENAYAGTLQRNDMGSVNFQMEAMTYPDGAVEGGLFSVSATKQVFFAKGNLQYKAVPAPGIWQFAEHQYDITGSNNENIGSNYNDWIDLFGWATSGLEIPAGYNDSYMQRNMPYAVSMAVVNKNNNYYGYGPSGNNANPYDLTGANAFLDWGTAVSGDITWRTLLATEFHYLLEERSVDGNSSHHGVHYSYDIVVVNGVSGILIYPDGYTSQLSASDLASGIADVPHGCAFLPAAGYRDDVGNTTYHSSYLYYWTSSARIFSDESWNARGGHRNAAVVYRNGNIIEQTVQARYIGYAVRVVSDYNH